MLEVITNLTTPAGGGRVAVMHFDEVVPPQECVDYVEDFWTGLRMQLGAQTVARVQGSGRLKDEATGQVTGFYSATAPAAVLGALTDKPLADATQGLVQWRTGVVRGGREVRGRTFIPGLTVGSLDGGNLSGGARDAIGAAASALAGPITGFGVWSRPVEGRPGLLVQASGATVWTEFAVLRRRRS